MRIIFVTKDNLQCDQSDLVGALYNPETGQFLPEYRRLMSLLKPIDPYPEGVKLSDLKTRTYRLHSVNRFYSGAIAEVVYLEVD